MTKATRKAIGARIRSLRKQNGLTQVTFANMVNIERAYLSRVESGERNPSIDMIERIANGFGLTLSEFLDGI
ncbi:helix-turn-helix domain-containing protein [Raoultibacter phocaeensis]|uniref:helix-turn-helix domain-containing protein n=1 Tax=Raoultibacter phocaeensis TaxID=2479841 RepID=UPI0011185603|nr:helix-turn-helix transcriptional regulator [Raoultibacter phocaeensis]